MTAMPSGGITSSIGSRGGWNTWGIASIENQSQRHRAMMFTGRGADRRCAHIGVCLGVVIGIVAAGYGRDLDTGERASNVGGGGYLIRHASLVLTMDPNLGDGGILGPLENADVLIVGDRIAAVGANLAGPDGVRIIDGRGTIVMPGFVDTHDHLWQSLIRGCAAADAYAGVRLSTAGLIETGVTTVVDWSAPFGTPFIRGNVRGLVDSKMRFAFAMFGSASDGSDIVAIKAEFIDPNPLATLQVATHPAPFFVTHVGEATAIAKALGVKLHVHLLENISQVAEDPLGILQAAGAFDLGRDLHVAHAIHLSDANIATFATLGASVSHQPLSNMRLASGIMRYPDIQAAGIRIGLGLDGGTNDTTDMFNNMRAAVGLQRAKSLDADESPTVAEVLRAVTLGGAETLDMEHQIGSLTPGKQADLIVLEQRALNFAPLLRPVNQIVFNGQPQNVAWVFVAGRALKEKGKLKGVDVGALIKAAQTATDHIAPFLLP
jgi:5-methylthioadenosine/S-adenosylhomocysteine deaminase